MLAEQTLAYPTLDATPAPARELNPRRDDVLDPLVTAAEAERVRPRGSVDTGLAVISLLFALALANPERIPLSAEGILSLRLTVHDLALAVGLFLLWPRLLLLFGAYDPRRNALSEVLSVVTGCSVGAVLATGFVAFGRSDMFTPSAVGTFWLLSVGVTLTFRGFARALNTSIRARGPRRVLIVGSGLRALRLYHQLVADPEQFELIGFVDDSDESASDDISRRLLGRVDQLESILMHTVVDEVLIALPIKSCYEEIQRAIEVSARVGVESKYLADAFRCSLAKPRFEQHRTAPVMSMKVFYDDYRVSLKRALDFTGALIGILLLSPVLLAIALAVKLTSPGPVLFAQERYGLNKRRFKMYKFRTMVPNAEALLAQLEDQNEAAGPIFKMKNDPRVTPIGSFLRKTSLDELPQLINVLKGDMSLVGPRPMAVRDVQLFDQAWFMRRFSAPPGMTGLWQVSGRSNLGFDDWVTLDLKYIDEWSLAMDLKILAKTVPVVMRGVGAV